MVNGSTFLLPPLRRFSLQRDQYPRLNEKSLQGRLQNRLSHQSKRSEKQRIITTPHRFFRTYILTVALQTNHSKWDTCTWTHERRLGKNERRITQYHNHYWIRGRKCTLMGRTAHPVYPTHSIISCHLQFFKLLPDHRLQVLHQQSTSLLPQ